jgi:phosphohistidine phosphatase
MSGRVQLYLLRHADAGDPEAWHKADAERPLSEKGRRQAERLGAFLATNGFAPDAIVSSPKVRAAETAELLAGPIGRRPVTLDPALAGGLSIEDLDPILARVGDPTRVVLVGHDPDFSELLAELCGASSVPMRKGALARVDIVRPVRAGEGTLRWLIPPDVLKPEA